MTISTTDLQIYQAQRNRDTSDGGGAMSPTEVIDGELNNVFDDISSQDRTSGRVSIRKKYAGVFSSNTDKYFGAGLTIVAPAADDAVNILMTATGSYSDERADVVNLIESYLIPGATLLWRLFNDHLKGTGNLTLYAPLDAPTPDLGHTLFLESTDSDLIEPVKIEQIISRSTQSFFDDRSDSFQRDILVLQITRPLLSDHGGTEVLRRSNQTPPTRIKQSTVSSGARYYGVKAADNVSENDLSVKVANPFATVVPSTTAESPITDQAVSSTGVSFAKVGTDNAISIVTGSQSFDAGENKTFFLGGTVYPGSIAITGTVTGEDNGDGTVTFSGSQTTAVIDYVSGSVDVTRSVSGSISLTITATPGASVSDGNLTVQIPVTQATRQLNYVRTLRPLPAPRTLAVDYRALDNWYRLTDTGLGTLAGGQPGEGSGNINYATGTVTATLAALPDIGTSIIVSWGTGVTITNRSSDEDIALSPAIVLQLNNFPAPGSVAIEYTSGEATVNLEDSAGDIIITGTATVVGKVNYSRRTITLTPTSYPNAGAAIAVTFNQFASETTETFTPTASGATDEVTFSLANAAEASSVRIRWPVKIDLGGRVATVFIEAIDDGAGVMNIVGNGTNAGGTINYGSGAITMPLATLLTYAVPNWQPASMPLYDGSDINSPEFQNYQPTADVLGRYVGGNVQAFYQVDSAATEASSQNFATPPMVLELTPKVLDATAAGSVRFTLNGRTYVDRQGDLVYNPSPTTNAGTVAGTIDYQGGTATITDWAAGSNTASIVGLGTIYGITPVSRALFRTPAAPITQASLTVQANRWDDSTLLQATAAADGTITAANIQGFVDVQTGVVEVLFGEWVTAAGNEAEWWYNADAIVDGDIFKPVLVMPGSITFSVVALTSIPLDPQILGLDPIRLPSDGRVPIFRPGDTLVISQRKEVEDSSPSAGAVVELGLNNVRWVRIKDSTGAEVLSEHYTVDGPEGELTWANPLDLSAYVAPYKLQSMSYFMRLCTDVQINGTISMAAGAPFSMLNATSPIFLSSKLVFTPEGGSQDLQALYTNLFTQVSWNNEWSNSPTSGGTTGQYDDVNFPIVMTNIGSTTERWRAQFTAADTVNIIGETRGQVLTGANIGSAIAPINPATSQPYFTIPAGGWSGGWVTGNVVRFNTLGANFPVWSIRSTQPSDPDDAVGDRFIAHLMGDVAPEAE